MLLVLHFIFLWMLALTFHGTGLMLRCGRRDMEPEEKGPEGGIDQFRFGDRVDRGQGFAPARRGTMALSRRRLS